MFNLLQDSGFIIFLYATLRFLISLKVKRNDIADIAWWCGYILLWAYYMMLPSFWPRETLIYALILIWWTRLSYTIYQKVKNRSEDFRYANRRKQRGKVFYIRSYLQVYLLQGIFLLIIISPMLLVTSSNNIPIQRTDIIWICLWVIWFYRESVGDKQLANFKQDKNNSWKILNTWLWKYSRHPNYFGEVVMRWAIWFLALPVSSGVFALVSPITITLLIVFVSGIPMLEKKYEWNKDYERYKKDTSIFIPLPTKIRKKISSK